MTGIYNKTTSENMAMDILHNHPSLDHAMILVDIDNFKVVNDTEGHQVGDHTLRIIADALSSRFRQSDVVGRIGGDEFLVLMNNIPSKEIARKKIQEIIRLMQFKPNLTLPANVSVSIGLAFSNRSGIKYKDLFEQADKALFESKGNGRARYTEYGFDVEDNIVDERRCVISLSSDRLTQGIIDNALSKKFHYVDVFNIEELKVQINNYYKNTAVVFVDVSLDKDDGIATWHSISAIDTMASIPVIALCREGSMAQIKATFTCDSVVDVISLPLDEITIDRRVKLI